MHVVYWITVMLAMLHVSWAVNHVSPVLILVDGFSHYLGEYCKSYCKDRGIYVKEVVSPYLCGIFKSQGRSVPEHLRAPEVGEEMGWSSEANLGSNEATFAISESESGVSTAERIQTALDLCGNGPMPQLRNKYLQNVKAKCAGLPTVEQTLAKSWEAGSSFLTDLWARKNNERCVLKPCRGVASDGVYCCEGLRAAEAAFRKLLGKPQYGGGTNKAVLIQEHAEGPEYAVDTVTRDGETKVLAVWKYQKLPANGAPFVYQCTELVSSADSAVQEVSDYCVNVLEAQGLRWGPAHTEVRLTAEGPRLMEINARWHAQNFVPVVRRCLGVDAVTATMDSFFDPDAFDALPARPAPLSSNYGMIVHLISRQEGIIKSIRHLDEITSLPSVHVVEIPSAEGDVLVKTVDIRTDAGYVLLMHEDPAVLQADYERILQLQDSLFEVAGDKVEEVPQLQELEVEEIHVTMSTPLAEAAPHEGNAGAVQDVRDGGADEASANECSADDRARTAGAEVEAPVSGSARSPPYVLASAPEGAQLQQFSYPPNQVNTVDERLQYQLQHPHLTPESIVRENIPFALAPVSKLGGLQHNVVVKKGLEVLKINAAMLGLFYALSVLMVGIAPLFAKYF